MKGDYSKIPFDERKKMQHYRKVYLQQGKVLLDSDLNENTDLLHYQMKTLVKDGLCGSPNIGFRIGRGVPLVPVDDHRYIGKGKGWDVDKGTLTIDYFNKFEGKGSLELENAKKDTKVSFTFQKPVDLSRYRYIRLALYSTAENPELILNLFDGQNETTIEGEIEQNTDQNDFSVIKYAFPHDAVLDNITKIYLTGFNSKSTYRIGAVECSPPMFTLEPMTHIKGWDFDPAGSAEISIDGEGINASQVTELYKEHFSSVDFSKFETLEFAIKCSKPYDIQFYVSDVEEKTSYWDINIVQSNELEKYSIENLQDSKYSDTPANLEYIKKYGFRSLHTGTKYHFGSILYEMSLENNFVISGAEPLSGESGRLYVDGELYEKEEAETYLNQKDCLYVPPIESPSQGSKRTDLVYVDVWQRHVTSAEDPELREVAVGVDTCNRMKALAQVKVREGETSLDPDLEPTGGGRLSTVVEFMKAEKLCEITPGVEYTGLENRLYRVEIHTSGKVGGAAYKWSRNNASIVSQIIENVNKDTTSVKVKDVKFFKIGDIIEITDDRVEFADRQYINNESSIKPWGELRRITSIDRNKNELAWANTSEASDNPLSMAGGLDYNYAAEGVETTHPRVIKWDGANKTSNEETLEDGIKIRFSGSEMLPGDYWTFTARENTRAVERLDNEPPQGVVHHYYPLAIIEWDENGEIISIEDKRTKFEPLCGLTAADLAFDNANTKMFEDAENVQQALEILNFPLASGIDLDILDDKCKSFYSDAITVQAALYNICNGIPSLTLKGEKVEQGKWPKLECSDSGDISFLTGAESSEDSMRICADGKVGIGIDLPEEKLHVKTGSILLDNNQAVMFKDKRGTRHQILRLDANNDVTLWNSKGGDDDDIYLGTGPITDKNIRMVVKGDGRVGIGTTRPSAHLHVDQASPGGDSYVTYIGPGWNNGSAYNKGNQRLGIFAWEGSAGVSLGEHGKGGYLIENVGGDLTFKSGYNGTRGEKLRIMKDGNVGIGTDEPKNKLDVKGGAVIGIAYSGTKTAPDNGLLVQGNVGIGEDMPKSKLHVTGNAGVLNLEGENHTYIQWYPDGYVSGRKAWTGFGNAGSNDFAISNEIDGGDILLLPKKGNVGIGTTTKPKAKLDVNGTIKSTALSGDWDKSSGSSVGYVTIGQLLIIWGQTTVNFESYKIVTFPVPFDGTNYSFFAEKHGNVAGHIFTVKIKAHGIKKEGYEGIIYHNVENRSQKVSWLAIGPKMK